MRIRDLITCMVAAAVAVLPSISQAAFQDMGWGARPTGMGGSFVALSDDANASFWNPAGLGQLDEREASFMYAKPYMGIEGIDWGLLYLTYAHPVKSRMFGVFGINATSFSTGGLYRESSASLSYAWRVSRSLNAGVNVKYLHHVYNWDEETLELADPVVTSGKSKGSIAVDAGALLKRGKMNFGLCLRNMNQPDVGLYSEDVVPMEARAGAALRLGDVRRFEDLVLSLDLSYRNQDWLEDKRISFFFGTEAWLGFHTFGIRAGLNGSGLELNEITCGLSINRAVGLFTLGLDYSLAWPLNLGAGMGTHRVSTGLKF